MRKKNKTNKTMIYILVSVVIIILLPILWPFVLAALLQALTLIPIAVPILLFCRRSKAGERDGGGRTGGDRGKGDPIESWYHNECRQYVLDAMRTLSVKGIGLCWITHDGRLYYRNKGQRVPVGSLSNYPKEHVRKVANLLRLDGVDCVQYQNDLKIRWTMDGGGANG